MAGCLVAWEIVQVCGGMWASETRRAEASPVIGANAAFNNRTKEELEMHMFKKCGFPPKPLSLSHSVALVILYWLWVWQKTKKSRKEAHGAGEAHRFCKVLLDVFIHFYVRIISSPATVWGGARATCSWLMESHLNFWSQCVFPRSSLHLIDTNIFYLNIQPHLFMWTKCMYAHSHYSLNISPSVRTAVSLFSFCYFDSPVCPTASSP